jgi:hypothetical protein
MTLTIAFLIWKKDIPLTYLGWAMFIDLLIVWAVVDLEPIISITMERV